MYGRMKTGLRGLGLVAGMVFLCAVVGTRDEVTSPCVDTGDPGSAIGGEPFPNGGRVDMGAYGGTGQANKSWFGGEPCETIVAGDIDGDCRVDFRDFRLVCMSWMRAED